MRKDYSWACHRVVNRTLPTKIPIYYVLKIRFPVNLKKKITLNFRKKPTPGYRICYQRIYQSSLFLCVYHWKNTGHMRILLLPMLPAFFFYILLNAYIVYITGYL